MTNSYSSPQSQNALHSETVAVRGAARLVRPENMFLISLKNKLFILLKTSFRGADIETNWVKARENVL